MSITIQEEVAKRFAPTDDPEILAKRRWILRKLLEYDPTARTQLQEDMRDEFRAEIRDRVRAEIRDEVRDELRSEIRAELRAELRAEIRAEVLDQIRDEARIEEARAMLRRVIDRRQLALTAVESERIEACADLSTLHRWIDQAFTASSAGDALQ